MIRKILTAILLLPTLLYAQINTERVMTIARNALYFEDYVLSIQYFNQVINAKPYLYEPYFFRGLAKINLDDYQGAESDCDAAIQRNPFVVGAYQIRGLARIRQNKFDEAIEDYKTAIKYDPENVVLWHNLSLCHIQKEDYEAAKEDLGTLLTIAPKYTRAYLMRGEVSQNIIGILTHPVLFQTFRNRVIAYTSFCGVISNITYGIKIINSSYNNSICIIWVRMLHKIFIRKLFCF